MRKQKRDNRGRLAGTMAVAALMAFFALTGTVLSARWEVFYEANRLPDHASLRENVWTTTGQAFREINPPGILRIQTAGKSDACYFSRRLNDISKVTVEVGIKVVANAFHLYQVAQVSVGDMSTAPAPGAGLLFFEDEIQLYIPSTADPWGPTYHVDMRHIDEYRIVRLVKDGLDVRVYLDNEEKPILEYQLEFNDICRRENYQFWGEVNGNFIFTTAPERTWIQENGQAAVNNGSIITVQPGNATLEDIKASFMPDYRIGFGCSASNDKLSPSESCWDYVAYTTKGAFSPGESLEREVKPRGKLTTTWGGIRTVQ